MCQPMMKQKGFTLVEVLVALVVISVGMLALGAFYTSMIKQESIAQERIEAVHMAEQLIEDWERTNKPPTPNCTVPNGTVKPLIVGTQLQGCTVDIGKGVPVSFDILINEQPAKAPLPVSHPNNPNTITPVINSSGVDVYTMLQKTDVYGNVIQNSPPVMVRSVTVSWTHGTKKPHSVLLTHITRYIQ